MKISRWYAMLLWLLVLPAAAQPPDWWSERGVLVGERPPADYHPVNQGQLKWIAAQAAEEFLAKLPGPENADLLALIDAFPVGHDYRPANLGMLKAAAQPFYDRLIVLGWAADYPWTGGTPADYNLANQGQLKQLFSFDLDAIDLDEDGVPDWWTRMYGFEHYDEYDNPLPTSDAYQAWLDAQASPPPDDGGPVGDGSPEPPPQSTPTDTLVLDGAQAVVLQGTWVREGATIRAATRRGRVAYTATLAQPDIYRLRIALSQGMVIPGASRYYDLRLAVNGDYLARQRLWLQDDQTGIIEIDTPFLNAGDNQLELFWDNPVNGLSLRVEEVRWQQWNGPDSNNSGLQDWVENRLRLRNGVERAPRASAVSPAAIEGRGPFAGAVSITGAETVHPGPNDTWHARVPLPDDGAEVSLEIALENGGVVRERPMRWKTTDLLSDLIIERTLLAGDALRLAAAPPHAVTGSAQVLVNGLPLDTLAPGEAVPYTFATAGVYTVTAEFTGADADQAPISASRDVTFTVLDLAPEIIAAQVGHSRPWQPPAHWPAQAHIEWDERLDLSAGSAGFLLSTDLPEERHGVVRLGARGPVLAPITVRGFNLWVMRNTDLFYETIYPDGSFRAETTMIMSPVLPEVWIEQRCRGPVAYLDGSRVRVFEAADFDSLGEIVIMFAHSSPIAHSVCHYTDAFQEDILIGRGY